MANITMTSQFGSSYLEIILGGMYAGKTSRLVEIYKQCKFCSIPVSVINHSIDTRYDDEETESLLSTHDKIKIPCIKTEKLRDIWKMTLNDTNYELNKEHRLQDKIQVELSDVILINEGQFFPDLEEFVKCMLSENKQVYICGLDGDFKRQKRMGVC